MMVVTVVTVGIVSTHAHMRPAWHAVYQAWDSAPSTVALSGIAFETPGIAYLTFRVEAHGSSFAFWLMALIFFLSGYDDGVSRDDRSLFVPRATLFSFVLDYRVIRAFSQSHLAPMLRTRRWSLLIRRALFSQMSCFYTALVLIFREHVAKWE
jgi:hypothetical protein